ncbi:cyclic GMP-AMP synthase-like receptor isoform X1 [Schistocerca piceifrons]|uniref:cyclic GMP-AMP synthase-like receptor isoform X1 n=1 Tax=Schistocerca piceifrons TaxID=274613 RepID=UPI001F5F5787|nr:cyclic GMP-AMP synthase-like receptor isoform X1 [Schistocerca piceifrons]XP_047111153.1 cyclic GMP-AMP synthase-like receptor isoform X1 [Schistocerca piceifrons]
MANYKALDSSIQKILKESISLDEQQKKQYNAKLQELFDILETEMKKQEDFKALFRQKQYVGSYFENLKIEEPDEFDVDFELVIPSYVGELKVCASPHPGFCQLKLNPPPAASSSGNDTVKTKVKKWFDEKGFMLRSKVHQWMQGVVDNALREYRSSDMKKTFKIARSYSGPAITLNVEHATQPEMKFSIDLVPVFVFQGWPTTVHKLHKYKKTMGDDKKLRDVQNWKGIASYYLKTLFLWKNDTDYNWSKSMGELFIEMLGELKEYLLVKKALPFYWVSECNLFSQLKDEQKKCMGGFLQRMIADIERNLDKPDYLLKYFKLSNGNSSASGVSHALASLTLRN